MLLEVIRLGISCGTAGTSLPIIFLGALAMAIWLCSGATHGKLNFDGASRGNPRISGIRAVIRDSSGELMGGLLGSSGFATNNEAEIRAVVAGLDLCVQKGYDKVIIEGDSQIIVNDISKSSFQNWKLGKWIPYINKLLGSINSFELKQTFREGNKVADLLANVGIDKDLSTIIFNKEVIDKVVLEAILNEIPDLTRMGVG
ncbi:uncharacterized protein LOC131858991 [Cryptomeria japonica]|uniref:uncharacterized protein LOC131858991 n=1 Tax=Cryptomeria japonica TaxID=3369 RepID=UPI0027DA21E8|nr:uncharacterized protein LOC131858991 [Cryptomeria japonica]